MTDISEKIIENGEEIEALAEEILSFVREEPVGILIPSLMVAVKTVILSVKRDNKERGDMLLKVFDKMVENVREN